MLYTLQWIPNFGTCLKMVSIYVGLLNYETWSLAKFLERDLDSCKPHISNDCLIIFGFFWLKISLVCLQKYKSKINFKKKTSLFLKGKNKIILLCFIHVWPSMNPSGTHQGSQMSDPCVQSTATK